MSSRGNNVIRSMHDVGAAVWCGGALMGAIGLNGASHHVSVRTERAQVAAAGWARWAPVNAAAIGAHLIGGAGLVLSQRRRVAHQSGTIGNTIVKSALTALALGSTAYSGVLGAKLGAAKQEPTGGGTKPSTDTASETAKTQQQLRILQWATPVLTAAIIVLGAQQGEQQRPASILAGLGRKAVERAGTLLPS